jgi:hypothetical protein
MQMLKGDWADFAGRFSSDFKALIQATGNSFAKIPLQLEPGDNSRGT